MYDLPIKITINDIDYEIRSDFRAILDVITALNDPNLNDQEKILVILQIIYVEWENIDDYQQALNKAMGFINCGEPIENKNTPILMDWEKDFKLIISPVNRILGYECRAVKYLHWWTFISAYTEIGECTFSTFVSIRKKKNKHKKLEKWEEEIYRENIDKITLKQKIDNEMQSKIDDILASQKG